MAIITDGTAVLGLGDIGPEAAMPVMEGKAMLLKALAGLDAYPICLRTKDPQQIIDTVCNRKAIPSLRRLASASEAKRDRLYC